MIGFLQGRVLFSDGSDLIVLTNNGVGHQIYFNYVLPEGKSSGVFTSHIVKETSEELYGFQTLRQKKLFELLITVKGVGPKSAYSLITSVSVEDIIEAVTYENKKLLTKAPGIGAKAAAQILLDLSEKIKKVKMYSNKPVSGEAFQIQNSSEQIQLDLASFESTPDLIEEKSNPKNKILEETLLACTELGFKEDDIFPLAKKVLENNSVARAEQLVHLVLKEI